MANAIDQRLFGSDMFGESMAPKAGGKVSEKFTFPPFSVLDARSGDWQERKRAWMDLKIKGEVGREKGLSYAIPTKSYNHENMEEEYYGNEAQRLNTSIFDPVICELAYSWFCKEGGQIIDPFAGGSVRGVVAEKLGRLYWGCDLRREQIDANNKQGAELCNPGKVTWECGDARDLIPDAPRADFVFSCPPYGDLERYSDDPRDLSQMGWQDFCGAYRHIISLSAEKLKLNRFACFVVGNFRDSNGFIRDLVGETVRAFNDCGCYFYNEGILVTMVASASMRVSKQFESGRKFAKTHQNVLVFCKGDWEKATLVASGKLT